ncbi:LysM peptidoglycan-binding domain-containing protein [Proteobacteria bacterium 005FR1]|nr:LysM peptidoglycan-binding domain-containing protein [Proteobacteria bacterium 005FR1]
MLKNAVIAFIVTLPLYGCSQLTSLTQSDPVPLVDAHPLPDYRDDDLDVLMDPSYDPNCFIEPEVYAAYPQPDFQNVWNRLRAGFRLQYVNHPRIATHRDWYARNPTYMARVSERAERYMYAIAEKIEERGLPMELALLPIVESAFDPFAYSHGRASGMWQFIPSTGEHYGLKQNWWYDGRRDIEASTDAALDYLSTLHGYFDGDWLLALAAYNTGQGNLRRAIRRNEQAGKPTDFWSLDLPRETRAYVPQLLALSQLVAEPDKYNIALNPIPNRPFYDVVDIDSQIDLAKAAEMAQMEIEDLYLLNPAFNRWATDPSGPHRLLIPVDNTATFIENLKAYPLEQRLAWETYTVRRGDSLAAIARRFNTTIDTLQDVNQIRGTLIRQGEQLLIPTATSDPNAYALSADQRLAKKQDRGGNEGAEKVSYTVKRGDSFWGISRRYNVSVNQLAKWNGMAPKDPLRVGQKLVVWSGKPTTVTAKATPASDRGGRLVRELAYRVRHGDSLALIANKFNLSVQDIAAWNSLEMKDYIHPGQQLKLIVDITNTH